MSKKYGKTLSRLYIVYTHDGQNFTIEAGDKYEARDKARALGYDVKNVLPVAVKYIED